MSDVTSDAPSGSSPETPPTGGRIAPSAAPASSSAPASEACAPPTVASSPGLPRLVTVNSVNWGNVLDFTQLFRGFRLAINPAKLSLALIAIVVIYLAGRTFDLVWGAQAMNQEIDRYAVVTPAGFRDMRDQALKDRDNKFKDKSYASQRADLLNDYQKAVDQARQAAANPPAPQPGGSNATPAERQEAALRNAGDHLKEQIDRLNGLRGQGIFDTLLRYETGQFDRLVSNVLPFNRVVPEPGAPGNGMFGNGMAPDAGLDPRSGTALGCLYNMVITAPGWLLTSTAPMQWRPDNAGSTTGWIHMMSYRALYLVSLLLFGVLALLMVGSTGAAITRLSALELAGIERAPLKDVFLFAAGRLWTFIKAPLMPFLIILAIGLVMALVAMLGAVPYLGPVLVGLTLAAFLGVSFLLMLLLLGILGGFNLLYPAIAVEGADSFDAMSRSFAYAYARPWRLAFYTLTSVVYGAATFVFVSFAVFLMLLLTHTFVGWGMNLAGAHDGVQSGLPALETIWPSPRFMQPMPSVNWYVMSWPEWMGAVLAHFWVYLLVGGIGAYVMSYYFSSHTIIYLLLRRAVDGQNLREVLLEEKAKA